MQSNLPIGIVEDGDWARVLDVNLMGTWRVARAFMPLLGESKGGAQTVCLDPFRYDRHIESIVDVFQALGSRERKRETKRKMSRFCYRNTYAGVVDMFVQSGEPQLYKRNDADCVQHLETGLQSTH